VIDVFPSIKSWVRIEPCYLMEYSEDWRSDRSYIKRENVQEVMERNRTFITI
jgi:ATP-dependent protease HslVU (ClpYQ) peptidase subunit